MRISITKEKGVVQSIAGNGIMIEGVDYREAPFAQRFEDLHGEFKQGAGTASLTEEALLDTDYFAYFFRHNQADKLYFTFQMTHSWDRETDVEVHVHTIPMASGSGNVLFKYAYAWAPVNVTVPYGIGWSSGSTILAITPADMLKHTITDLATIAPISGVRESSILFFQLQRDGTDPTDTYVASKLLGTAAANLAFLYCDVHFRNKSSGTDDEGD
jgi:hypothetical protein